MSSVGDFVMWSLILEEKSISSDEKSSLKLFMCIYTINYML